MNEPLLGSRGRHWARCRSCTVSSAAPPSPSEAASLGPQPAPAWPPHAPAQRAAICAPDSLVHARTLPGRAECVSGTTPRPQCDTVLASGRTTPPAPGPCPALVRRAVPSPGCRLHSPGGCGGRAPPARPAGAHVPVGNGAGCEAQGGTGGGPSVAGRSPGPCRLCPARPRAAPAPSRSHTPRGVRRPCRVRVRSAGSLLLPFLSPCRVSLQPSLASPIPA